MIFNTWSFAIFAIVAWSVYWTAVPQRLKPPYLIVAGIVFYAFSVPAFLALIAALAAVTYVCGIVLLRWRERERASKLVLTAGVALIVGVLITFKYTAFLALTVNEIASHDVLPVPHLVVPLAISFFTFEFVHVLVDIRLGKIRSLDPIDFLAFAFFFPTLVAGPIKRYPSFAIQLEQIEPPSENELLHQFYRIAIGLFKKLVIADSLTPLTLPLLHPGTPFHQLDYWVALPAYSLKIYFDFTGYSDIAIGVAGALGLAIPENFDRPYWSRNIQEFWRRWHITLSTWIRDYVFIPLGGSRRPPLIVTLNLVVAMALAGLWHGASLTFVIWGLWHGGGLAIQRVWAAAIVKRSSFLRSGGPLVTAASIATTFAFVTFGYIFFDATSFPNAVAVYGKLFARQ